MREGDWVVRVPPVYVLLFEVLGLVLGIDFGDWMGGCLVNVLCVRIGLSLFLIFKNDF